MSSEPGHLDAPAGRVWSKLDDDAYRRFLHSADVGHVDMSADGLGVLYQAWLALHPYDTFRKTLAVTGGDPVPGGDPSETVRWALDTRTGGTCVAGAVAFAAIVERFGFDATLVGCSLDSSDRDSIVHVGVRVDVDDQQLWCDTAVSHIVPLAVHPDGRLSKAPGWCESRVVRGKFIRRSQTSDSLLIYRFERDLDATGVAAVLDSTRHTIDWTAPLYAVRDRGARWAARGGPGGWTTMELGLPGGWTPADGRHVMERLNVDIELAGLLLELASRRPAAAA